MTRIINLCFFFILLLIPILFYIYKFVQNTNLWCKIFAYMDFPYYSQSKSTQKYSTLYVLYIYVLRLSYIIYYTPKTFAILKDIKFLLQCNSSAIER